MSVKPLVSVIIPVYNVEKYLHRCVDSVISQTHCNIEIILVDDGSPDNCPAICDEYAKKDSRITVIHKMNGGLSDARNVGIDASHGEWLSFIDSDDWIEPDMYETLLINADKYDAQISVGGVSDEIESQGKTTVIKTTFAEGSTIDKDFYEEITTEVLSCTQAMKRYFGGSWSAWDKIYKKEIFNFIRYPVGEINEDEAIVLQVLNECTSIVYTNKVLYHYLCRENSITTSAFSPAKLLWVKHCENNYIWILNNYYELRYFAAERFCSSILWALRRIALSADDFPKEVRELKKSLRRNYRLFFSCKAEFIHRAVLTANVVLPFAVYKGITKHRENKF